MADLRAEAKAVEEVAAGVKFVGKKVSRLAGITSVEAARGHLNLAAQSLAAAFDSLHKAYRAIVEANHG